MAVPHTRGDNERLKFVQAGDEKSATRVRSSGVSSKSRSISTETISVAAGAAGTTGVTTTANASIFSSNGALLGQVSDTSFSFVTGTVLTTEISYDNALEDAAQHALMSNGDYAIDYDTGKIRYKKATTATSDTANYKVRDLLVDTELTLDGVNIDNVLVSGDVAHDAVDSGNPVKIGGIALSAQQTAVSVSDRVNLAFNLAGEMVLAAYTWATNSLRTEEIDPIDEHYIEEELVDSTDLAAATNYYPSSTGKSLGNYNNVSIHGVTSGGVTVTVEAKIDDSTDWIDITPAGYRLDDNTTGNASFVDQTFMLDFDDLHVRNIRIKAITSDATNNLQIHWKLTAL